MANKSSIQTNLMRIKLYNRFKAKREALKKIIKNKDLPLQERFEAQLKLSKLPRNSSKIRIRNRCLITGRPRGYFRFFKMSRICIRSLAGEALLPGVKKSSW
jgi:small subunit ribosomal protein S14